METLLKESNSFFKGLAKTAIVNGRLEITIGSRTTVFSLPKFDGGRNDPME